MFDQIYVLKFKGLQWERKKKTHETYISYLLFMHRLLLLLPHSYHTSNDLAIRPQGVYWGAETGEILLGVSAVW